MAGLLDLFNMATEASGYDVAGNPIVYNPNVDRIRGAPISERAGQVRVFPYVDVENMKVFTPNNPPPPSETPNSAPSLDQINELFRPQIPLEDISTTALTGGMPLEDAFRYSPPFTPVNAAEQALKAGLDGGQAAALQGQQRRDETLLGGTFTDILSNPFVNELLKRFRDPAFQQPGFAGQGLQALAQGLTAADYNVRSAEAAARARAQEQATELQKELIKARPKAFEFSAGDIYKSAQTLSNLAQTDKKITDIQNMLTSPKTAVGGIAGGFDEIISYLGGAVGAASQTPQQKYGQIRSLILSTIGTAEAGGGGLSKQDYQLLESKLPTPDLVTSKQQLLDALKEVSDFIKDRQVFHRNIVETTGRPAEFFTTPKNNSLTIVSKENR